LKERNSGSRRPEDALKEVRGSLRVLESWMQNRNGRVNQKWKHDAEVGLVIVLGLIEQGGVDPVGFGAPRKNREWQAIVETNARLHRKRAAACRLQFGAAKCAPPTRTVCPGLKTGYDGRQHGVRHRRRNTSHVR